MERVREAFGGAAKRAKGWWESGRDWVLASKKHKIVSACAAGGALAALVLIIGLAAGLSGGGHRNWDPLLGTQWQYSLTEGADIGVDVWTAPIAQRPRTTDAAPATFATGITISAAKGEFEPFQLVFAPGSGSVRVAVAPFGIEGERESVFYATFTAGGYAEQLHAVSATEDIALSSSQPTPVFVDVYVPAGAPAGTHKSAVQVVRGSRTTNVTLTLRVFDFALDVVPHFASRMNMGIPQGTGESVADGKTNLLNHKFIPTTVTWPSGFRYDITWDNANNPARCSAFYDEPDEGADYSIRNLSQKYIMGRGWNGVGMYPATVLQFVSNSAPRPSTFCGVSLGSDPKGTAAYNSAWSSYLTALRNYLNTHGMLDRSVYYVQNEPQNSDDYATAISLCQLTKSAAPGLRISISEEPKVEIAGQCGFDIWYAHVQAYMRDYAWQRIANEGESVWFYSLPQDEDPYFCPAQEDKQGLHMRIIPWVSWAERARGFVYYDAATWWTSAQANWRAKLYREGAEDYEYLYIANGNAHPRAQHTEPIDKAVLSAAQSVISWNRRNPGEMKQLRDSIGLYIEGSLTDIPVMVVNNTALHPRAAYYINFQNPQGSPSASPLVVDGKNYTKVGWTAYSNAQGYGFTSQYLGNTGIALYGYDSTSGYDDIERSYVYDDYGRPFLFDFAIENGRYNITICVGRPARGYPSDPHNAWIEGTKVVDEVVTTNDAPQVVASLAVDITDGFATTIFGGKSRITGDYAYTFAAYMWIEPI